MSEGADTRLNVLFLCTGNSTRSILAEAMANRPAIAGHKHRTRDRQRWLVSFGPQRMSRAGTMLATPSYRMPSLTVTDVTRIAAQAAREQSPSLEIVGVTVGREGTYAEVIIDIAGCRVEPCRFSVGVFRDAPPAVVREEIASKLKQHVLSHAQRT